MVIVNNFSNLNDFCPECNGGLIPIWERGDIVCRQCGAVTTSRALDYSHPEKRAYTLADKSKKERTGKPVSYLIPDFSLTTIINKHEAGNNPNLLRAIQRDTYLSWKSRNLIVAITELKRLSHLLHLPTHIKNEALKLYKQTYSANILRGRSILGMVAACIYYTTKQKQVPRTYQDILNESSVAPERVKKCYKILVRKLNLKVHVIDPLLLIPKYVSSLGLSNDVEKTTIHLLKIYMQRSSLTGRSPNGICAGAIYFATKLKNIKITQKRIAKAVGVSEVTLRSRCKEIMQCIRF